MSIKSDVQTLSLSGLIDLYELDLNPIGVNEIFRFHAMYGTTTGSIYWQGNEYVAFPIEAEGFEYNGNDKLPRPTLRVANITGVISSLLQEMDDLLGAKITRKRTLSKYLDSANFPEVNPDADPDQHLPDEIWFIDRKATETKQIVEFELSVPWDLEGTQLPFRPCDANICSFKYRGPGCEYAGGPVAKIDDTPTSNPSLDNCSKRPTGCKLRFGANNPLRFGGFPSVGIIR